MHAYGPASAQPLTWVGMEPLSTLPPKFMLVSMVKEPSSGGRVPEIPTGFRWRKSARARRVTDVAEHSMKFVVVSGRAGTVHVHGSVAKFQLAR